VLAQHRAESAQTLARDVRVHFMVESLATTITPKVTILAVHAAGDHARAPPSNEQPCRREVMRRRGRVIVRTLRKAKAAAADNSAVVSLNNFNWSRTLACKISSYAIPCDECCMYSRHHRWWTVFR